MSSSRPGFWRVALFLGGLSGAAGGPAPASAQEQPKALEVQQSVIRPSVGGLYSYVPGKWSVLGLTVSNPDNHPRDVLNATYFDGAPNLQYGRRLWIPAKARLKTWEPVMVPQLEPGAERSFAFHSVVLDLDRNDHDEVLSRENSGELLHSGVVPARVERPVTGFLTVADEKNEGGDDLAYNLVVAARIQQHLTRKLSFFDDHESSPDEFSLQSLDQLVVANGELHNDSLAMTAIRRWVYNGGSLWVMLDRVDPRFLEQVLGDEFACEVVDRVGLTSVIIEPAGQIRLSEAIAAEYEQPVDLVRVVLAGRGMAVDFTVNGWPVAFSMPFGAGRVLVTTLGARGLMRPRRPTDDVAPVRNRRGPSTVPNDGDWERWSAFMLLPPAAELTAPFLRFTNRTDRGFDESLSRHSSDYVGYSIPPRWLIMGLLTGLAGAVVVAGIWLWRRQTLEHLGWIGPGLALTVTVVLLVIGGRSRHAISAVAASVDFVEAIPGTDDLCGYGTAISYSPESGPWTIGSASGGIVVPDMAGQEGTTRRLIWSDLDVWNWQNLWQATPQRSAHYFQSQVMPERVEADGAFGPDGFSGRLSIPATIRVSDEILVTHSGQLGVELHADGTFRADADHVLARNQFIGGSILSDEQNRRQRTTRAVLEEFRNDDWTDRAWIFLWSEKNLARFGFSEERRLLGTSLLAVPLIMQRPAVGTSVQIPSPFLPYRSTAAPDGRPPSALWDRRKQIWHEHAGPARVWLSFRLPAELAPIELTGGRLAVQVAGPLGRLEVLGLRTMPGNTQPGSSESDSVLIRQWDDPVGTLSVPLNDPTVLQVGSDGGVAFGFSIAGPPKPDRSAEVPDIESKVSYWRIEDVSLELTGKILAVDESRLAAVRRGRE